MLEKLRSYAFLRGVRGESSVLLGIWVLLVGVRFLKKWIGDEPVVVFREELEAGQQLIITHQHETHG